MKIKVFELETNFFCQVEWKRKSLTIIHTNKFGLIRKFLEETTHSRENRKELFNELEIIEGTINFSYCIYH